MKVIIILFSFLHEKKEEGKILLWSLFYPLKTPFRVERVSQEYLQSTLTDTNPQLCFGFVLLIDLFQPVSNSFFRPLCNWCNVIYAGGAVLYLTFFSKIGIWAIQWPSKKVFLILKLNVIFFFLQVRRIFLS